MGGHGAGCAGSLAGAGLLLAALRLPTSFSLKAWFVLG